MKQLAKGVHVTRGYVQVRLMHKGRYYTKNFGLDSDIARELANGHAAEKRREILLGQFSPERTAERVRFKEASAKWLYKWSREIGHDGLSKHNRSSVYSASLKVTNLNKHFGSKWFDEVQPKHVLKWREDRLQEGVTGTTINREQNVLSSIFGQLDAWVKTEQLRPFRLPSENPASAKLVKKAPLVKRERLLSTQELTCLKTACEQANDNDMWEICKLALKSLLRKKDLFKLDSGLINTTQSKTGKAIKLPIHVLFPLNYINFQKRWNNVRKSANIVGIQFRDLRKTGANLLKLKNHSTKLISEFLGHTSTQTTELYMVKDASHLKALATDLSDIVDAL